MECRIEVPKLVVPLERTELPQRDDKLRRTLEKLRAQGRQAYLSAADQIVNPRRARPMLQRVVSTLPTGEGPGLTTIEVEADAEAEAEADAEADAKTKGPTPKSIPAHSLCSWGVLSTTPLLSLLAPRLHCLTQGAWFVIRLKEFYQHEDKLLLWFLVNCFRKVELAVDLTTQDTFAVCRGFQGLEATKQDPEIPLVVSAWLTKVQNEITMQRETRLTKVVWVTQQILGEASELTPIQLEDLVRTCRLDRNLRLFLRNQQDEDTAQEIA